MQIVARSSCISLLVRGSYNSQLEFYLKINKILGNNCEKKKLEPGEVIRLVVANKKKKQKNKKKSCCCVFLLVVDLDRCDLNEDRLDMTQKRIPTSD